MAEVMNGLVGEIKKNKFSSIPKLTEEDVVLIWEKVSRFVERMMSQQKGVNIQGLGIFSFSQKKLDVGSNKFILIQRPVFVLSEKFAMTHGLTFTKHYTSGQIPVVQLNFTSLAQDAHFDRDTVESCVREVLQALARSIQAKRNVEFNFAGIGKMSIRDSKVKMKFYKDFLQSMDGSGNLINAMSNRPGTADSVMSEAFSLRPHTSNTLILPKIIPEIGEGAGGRRSAIDGDLDKSWKDNMPIIPEEEEESPEAVPQAPPKVEPLLGDEAQPGEETSRVPQRPSTSSNRQELPTAKAVGVSINQTQEQTSRPPTTSKSPTKITRERSEPLLQRAKAPSPGEKSPPRTPPKTSPELSKVLSQSVKFSNSRPNTACGHAGAGQELCYLCHQRSRRNVPVYFNEERQKKELEQDRLLQQYQHHKDAEAIVKEQKKNFEKRAHMQRIAAFNLGVADAVKEKKTSRSTEFSRSYVFQNRPLTPPRYLKQDEYSKDLSEQVVVKSEKSQKMRKEQDFLERLEQIQLAEDLAMQREEFIRNKKDNQNMYKTALDTQMRFKPLPLPAAEPDSEGPIFGAYDATAYKMDEQKRRANKLYKEQLDMAAQKKRDAILKDLKEQRDDAEMLERTKRDLILDRTLRHLESLNIRKDLENNWQVAMTQKKDREATEARRAQSPGMLLHEQCDKYNRCLQCGRRPHNCGESNIWSESRYVPGSRLIL